MVAARLEEDEKGRSQIATPGGMQNVNVINESGLYAVILRSDKPEAKRFRKWVTSEVLPSIRRTGGYVHAAPEDTPEIIIAKGMLAAGEAIERLKAQVVALQPKADALDRIADLAGSLGRREPMCGS